MHKRHGFTIVELLIVIVVIAILAAITIVAYNGIQTRAENAKTIQGTSQALKLLMLYKETNGDYPATGGMLACLGTGYVSNVCHTASDGVTAQGADVPAFDTALQTVGTLPSLSTKQLTLSTGQVVAGGSFEYSSKMIRYHLNGASQPCTVSGATGPYNYGNYTQCRIVLP